MFKPNTVIVLGAAMSAEVGLPLGWGLKQKISDLLPTPRSGGDDEFRYALLKQLGGDRGMAVAAELKRALPRAASIDNLVEHRGADEAFKVCAKMAIVAAILNGERGSKLYRKAGQTPGSLDAEKTTYADLFRILVGSARSDQLGEALARVAFVNFNYDRCLEHFLTDWLIGYSGLTTKDAAKLVQTLRVVRPYGSTGDVPFGAAVDGALPLAKLSDNILTFSEERGGAVDDEVSGLLAAAAQVIFLGCAYHPQNMKLLRPDHTQFAEAYGTCYMPPPADPDGLSRPSLDTFGGPTGQQFDRALRAWPRPDGSAPKITFQPLTCRQLVAKYAAAWTAT